MHGKDYNVVFKLLRSHSERKIIHDKGPAKPYR